MDGVFNLMTSRPYDSSDLAEIRRMYERQGFDYIFPDLSGPLMERVQVIEDEGRIVAAVGFERILQTYIWCDGLPPAQMQRVVEHFGEMESDLKRSGYDGVTAFLPPQIDKRFGRWLMRRFGWVKSWQAYGKRF